LCWHIILQIKARIDRGNLFYQVGVVKAIIATYNLILIMSVLSKPQIQKHLKEGNIIINPFNPKNLSNTSYDVRLGQYFFRQNPLAHTQTLNPFWEESMRLMYTGIEEATPVSKVKSQTNPFFNLLPSDKVILIAPNETILAHTIEFIGGKNGTKELPAVTTEMRARSSIGRIGIAVCKCAGWGDIGYINRWTMEITNFSNCVIPLPVGLRIAQIIFHETTPVESIDEYQKKGKYQSDVEIKKLITKWKPEDMLPKLYLDPDLGKFKKYSK
jgi:dCTP deaminase